MFKKIMTKFLFKKTSINDFNIVGLNAGAIVADELVKEMKGFKESQLKYLDDLDKRRRKLYEDFFEKKWTQQTMQEHKRILIDELLAKIQELFNIAKAGKIYKADYKTLKQASLDLLFSFFGSAEDFNDLDHSIEVLENAGVIPDGAKKEIILRSPVGRWYSK